MASVLYHWGYFMSRKIFQNCFLITFLAFNFNVLVSNLDKISAKTFDLYSMNEDMKLVKGLLSSYPDQQNIILNLVLGKLKCFSSSNIGLVLDVFPNNKKEIVDFLISKVNANTSLLPKIIFELDNSKAEMIITILFDQLRALPLSQDNLPQRRVLCRSLVNSINYFIENGFLPNKQAFLPFINAVLSSITDLAKNIEGRSLAFELALICPLIFDRHSYQDFVQAIFVFERILEQCSLDENRLKIRRILESLNNAKKEKCRTIFDLSCNNVLPLDVFGNVARFVFGNMINSVTQEAGLLQSPPVTPRDQVIFRDQEVVITPGTPSAQMIAGQPEFLGTPVAQIILPYQENTSAPATPVAQVNHGASSSSAN